MQVSCAPASRARAAAARAQRLGRASGCGMGRGARLASSSSSSFLTLPHLEGAQRDQDAPELRNAQDHRHSLVCSATLASWENKPQATRPGRREASPRPPATLPQVGGRRAAPPRGPLSRCRFRSELRGSGCTPWQPAGPLPPGGGGEGGETSPSPPTSSKLLSFHSRSPATASDNNLCRAGALCTAQPGCPAGDPTAGSAGRLCPGF